MQTTPETGKFIYHIPTKIYFGPDQLGNLGAELSKHGKKVLLVYGGGSIKRSGLYDRVVAQIKEAGLELFELSGVEPNPRVTSVNAGGEICRREGIDVVLAVGGGSTIDCSKYIAASAFYDGDAWDLVTDKSKIKKVLPIVSVLTLAATGSEMDTGGVITNLETGDKIGGGVNDMRPQASFLDPTETYTVSKYQTACGSADILSHLFEIYFVPEHESMFMLDQWKEGLIRTVIKYGPIAVNEPENYDARANLMWTSSWAINGFGRVVQKVAWSCHPIEHELSAIYDITHGLGLAIITPKWMRYVLDETTVDRFCQFGVNIFGLDASLPKMELAEKAIEATEDFLYNKLGLASTLTEVGIDETHIPHMAKKACGGKFINGYKKLYQEDIEKILRASL